jgi:3-phosphoglycerate kinase
MKDGEVILLENVRFYKQETKNDPEFAKVTHHLVLPLLLSLVIATAATASTAATFALIVSF